MVVPNEKRFDNLAWWFYKRGVRPDHLSLLQAPVYAGMAGVVFAAERDPRLLLWFVALQAFVVLLDGADGILARRTGTTTRRGHLLDSLFDIVGIGLTLWAIGHLYPTLQSWAFALLFLNFLVYIQNEIQGTKAVTYTRGPATIGLYLQQFYPGERLLGEPALPFVGILLPLAYGGALMLTRLEFRKRLWNYYQFLTAGQRGAYKATPREARAGLASPGARQRSEQPAAASPPDEHEQNPRPPLPQKPPVP